MVDRSFLLINFRSICSLIYARTFWDTLSSESQKAALQCTYFAKVRLLPYETSQKHPIPVAL